MRSWKKVLGIGVGISLMLQSAAFAEITIPPIPMGDDMQQGGVMIPGTGGPNVGTEAGAGTSAPEISSSAPAESQGAGPVESPASAERQDSTKLQEPVVVGEGAVLMDGATGKVLYGKNQDKQFYPASITKVMTALLVLENCNLSDTVTFSASATSNLESGAVALNITEGDQLTVEQSLYGLLLKSANEIANGLAEHISGSVGAFADKMNAKAAELGCRNTHFANPNGLNNSTHKTTPYDMALILRAALQNETFRKIDTTLTYQFPATKKAGARTITMGHKMMYPSDSRYYEGIIGGKTGYTSLAGNTLVTGVERGGVRLIAVVMKSKGTQYTDTKAMLDYGFANYAALTGQAGGSGPTASAAQAATGWIQDARGWYYVKADGAMAQSCWVQDGGHWYYLGADGVLLTNTTTPDGYQVDENGIWDGKAA